MSDVADFESLFLCDTPLIDTRSPGEFAKGSFPSAVNLPLMSDEERAAVGTCYKAFGQDAAVQLGHERVSGQIKASRILAWKTFATTHPGGALFCWRGGLRSEIAQQWLAAGGVDYPRVKGGYKAMRRWLIDELTSACRLRTLLVVGGKTGSAKTRLLNAGYQGKAFLGRVDLEGLANHRGSAFGRRLGGQPTQLNFDIALAVAVLKASRLQKGPIIIEDESRLIGRCALPSPLLHAKQTAAIVIVEASLEERVEHSYENYILANLNELTSAGMGFDSAFEQFSEDLLDALQRVKKRLGSERYRSTHKTMQGALTAHRAGHAEAHKGWIRSMLSGYYDPMYNYQIDSRRDRVIMRGSEQDIAAFLAEPSHLSAATEY